jgi:hypothetical protein
MRTKIKIPLLFSFLIAIGLLIIPTSCQEDYETIKEPLIKNKNLRIEVHQGEHTLNENPFLRSILSDVKTKKEQSRLISTTYNFAIEEELVQVLTGDNYIQYTFVVERENSQENVLENYVCKIMNNGLVYQYIIQYPYTLVNNDKNYIASQTNIIPIQNPDFVNTTSLRINCPPGSVPYLVDTSEQEICYSIGCSGGKGHSYGDTECPCGKTVNCAPARLECNTTTVYNWSCGGGGGTGDGNTGDLGTGGGSGTTDNSDSTTTTTVPFDDEKKPEEECKRIKEFLNTNATFKDSIIALAQTATTATSEKAVMLQSNGTITSHNSVNGKVETPQNPSNSYSASMHIHNGSNTYSIYSAGDLIWTGQTSVLHNKIDTRQFISFLATGKGTYYAFTITNSKKFTDFFNYLKWQKPTITPQERMDYLSIAEKRQKVWDKYYNASPIKIKENSPSTDKEIELEHFIDLLLEGDFGVSVFETDSSFSNFSPLQKNPINGATPKIIRKQCQN